MLSLRPRVGTDSGRSAAARPSPHSKCLKLPIGGALHVGGVEPERAVLLGAEVGALVVLDAHARGLPQLHVERVRLAAGRRHAIVRGPVESALGCRRAYDARYA